MKITEVSIGKIRIPLIRPFITALRSTDHVEDILIIVKTDTGNIGYGSVASTPAITGDFTEGIIYAIHKFIAPKLLGKSISNLASVLETVDQAIVNNNSAKCAVNIALYDLYAQALKLPLYKLLQLNTLGDYTHNETTLNSISSREDYYPPELNTCITISVKDPEQMAKDAKNFIKDGFTTLKVKLGINHREDIERIKTIRQAIGNNIEIIVDANQAWQSHEAVSIINKLNDFNINFIEQPLSKYDLDGLALVQKSVTKTIIADESCMSFEDAKTLCKTKITKALNIKLAKCGGLYQAQKIYQLAVDNGIKCMVGSMLESPIGIAAMAHFAASKPNLIAVDLDSIALVKQNPVVGGVKLENNKIILTEDVGLGITEIHSNSFEVLTDKLVIY